MKKRSLFFAFFAMLAIVSCKKDNVVNNPETVKVDIDNCSPAYKIYTDGRKITYDYTYRAFDGKTSYDLFTFEYITEYEKQAGKNYFREKRDFEVEDEMDEMMYSSLLYALAGDDLNIYVAECSGLVYSSMMPNFSDASVAYKLNASIGEKHTFKSISTSGHTGTSELTLKKENVEYKLGSKIFKCKVFDMVVSSSQPGSLAVSGEIWVDPDYGTIYTNMSTVEMKITSINK